MKCIIFLQILLNKKLLGICQDGSQEFLLFITTICVDGTNFSLILIY